ncbi:MAG: hypothetical protein LBT31_08990 [Synergistaceae bacterium]|jgi:uncharacterized Zn finger protein|nr:hypothetical protein [Synergistaceae bacterium]
MTAAERMRRGISSRRDGIRAETEFDGAHWWVEKWLDHILKISTSSRQVSAAKSCVRAGNVLEVNLNAGLVEAKVQGRRKAPYQVRLYCELPSAGQLESLKRRLSAKAVIGASLLSCEMPYSVQEAFAAEGVALLPNDFVRGRQMCSCPDQASSCKHILAVLFVLADVVDRDPLLLLKLRGLEREDLLESLLAPRGAGDSAAPMPDGEGIDGQAAEFSPGEGSTGSCRAGYYGSEELPRALVNFWNAPSDCASFPDSHTPLLNFPLWRGETKFSDSIEPYYESVRKMLRGK